MKEIPYIQIDFNKQSLIFTNPLKIIKTNCLIDLQNKLDLVEAAVKDGYYVAGFLSYEASTALNEKLITKTPNHSPLLWFGVFDKPVTVKEDKTKDQDNLEYDWHLAISEEQFHKTFKKIYSHIEANDIEQINYTTLYKSSHIKNGYSYYKSLKNAQKADYCAYIHTGELEVLSVSPELFFEVNDHKIKTKPMKGTVERGLSYEDDVEKQRWLEESHKNKLENDLTTDLMCHELRQVTEDDSIRIVDKHKVTKYPTVFQMTSTIEGHLKKDTSLTDILRAIFPCSSIAGKPKDTAMALISEIEQNERHIYCGSIGYMTPNQKAVFNVPIRTVSIDHINNESTYGVGGAITKNSTVAEEFAEIKAKAKVLNTRYPQFELLETIGLYDGNYLVLDNHLKRLKNSAAYFNYSINIAEIKSELNLMKKKYTYGHWRLRLLLSENGDFIINAQPFEQTLDKLTIKLATKPIEINNPFLYHKTTYRDMYEELKEADCFDTLLWNEKSQVTEFTIGNIVLELDGDLYTPPLHSGLLAGSFREELLKEGKIKERVIMLDDLNKSSQMWLINSVRQWVPVTLVK